MGIVDGGYDIITGDIVESDAFVTVEPGGELVLFATDKIVIKPGFMAMNGSAFWAAIDFDRDMLPDSMELLEGTYPDNPDTDGDGYLDGWEVLFGLNPLADDGDPSTWTDTDNDIVPDLWENEFSAKQTISSFWEDNDGDALINFVEFWAGTNPVQADADTQQLNSDSLLSGSTDLIILLPDAGIFSIQKTGLTTTLTPDAS